MKRRIKICLPQTLIVVALFLSMTGCLIKQPVPAQVPIQLPVREMALELGDGVNLEFVWIEAIKSWVEKYEVTNEEFRRYAPDHNSGEFEGFPLDEPRQPVVNVSYNDAVAFAEWINLTAKLPAGYKCRLPDGSEWLTFAQCGDMRRYPWGNEWPPNYGNYHGQEGAGTSGKMADYNDGYPVTCPVEKSGKNPWGLYGIGGNVCEWTSEWYDKTHECRVLRGASWDSSDSDSLKCAYRGLSIPTVRLNTIGFRVLLSQH